MAVTVLRVADLGADVLRVDGVDDAGGELVAYGWVSAMTNHYPDTAYAEDGHRDADVDARPMTQPERDAYWAGLLAAAAPAPAEAEPVAVLYQRPAE